MIRASFVAALMLAQAVSAEPLPTDRWQIEQINDGCEISRGYAAPTGTSLLIRRVPSDGASIVRFESPDVPLGVTTVSLRNEATGEELKVDAVGGDSDSAAHFLQAPRVSNTFLAGLAADAPLSFLVGGREVGRVAVTAAPAALSALDACEAELLRGWGVDPAGLAGLKARPEPASDARKWITISDYPASAIHETKPARDAILRYRVTAQGKIADCGIAQSSGSDALDRQACRVFERRGRYQPALGSDGAPREAWVVRTVRWSIL